MFWLKKYKSKQAVQQANPRLFENGKKVGIIAQDIFGKKHDDIVFNYRNKYKSMLDKTREYLRNKPNIITEATFNYNNNFCMVDILKNDTDGPEMYEVKAASKVTDIFIEDASFQYFVLSNLGLNVKKLCIVYINDEYIRQGELDLDEYFIIKDITSTAIEKEEEIRENIVNINKFMQQHNRYNEPDIVMGKQCSNPYDCDFCEYCTKVMEKNNINYKHIDKQDLNEEDTIHIDKEAIKDLFASLNYPLYFIDYETYSTPIPEIEGTKPFQQLPFQYSLHVLKDENAEFEHKEFLAQIDDTNFIRHFAESMINNIQEQGTVILYNKEFMGNMLNKELNRMFPDLQDEILRINDNIVDIIVPFRKKQHYTKKMKDSYSIKHILHALYQDNHELDYTKLSLARDGNEASDSFLSLENKSQKEQEKIRQELLEYSKLNTLAMVKIYEKFKEIIEE